MCGHRCEDPARLDSRAVLSLVVWFLRASQISGVDTVARDVTRKQFVSCAVTAPALSPGHLWRQSVVV